QNRLLRAAGRLHAARPELLRAALLRAPHALGFWTLLLLFNVDYAQGRVGKGSGQVLSVTRRPDPALWRRAWEQAVRMNAEQTLGFFESFHRTGPAEGAPTLLVAPSRWVGLVYRFAP